MPSLDSFTIKDRKLLYELDKCSRQTYLSLAKKIGTSKDVVIYRMQNLIRKGVIKKFYTIIDANKLGYFIVRVYLKFQNTTPKKEEEIMKSIVKIKNTHLLGRVVGEWDVAFTLWVNSHQEFDTLWLTLEKKYRKYFQKKETAIFTEYLNFKRSYLYRTKEKVPQVHVLGKKEQQLQKQNSTTDKKDLIILKALAEDARVSLIDLTKKACLTSKAISQRIKKLEKRKIILGYSTMIDLPKINYKYYKVDLNLEDLNCLDAMRSFIRFHPNSVYYERTIGGSDFEFDVECKDFSQFQEILNEFRTKFGKHIRDYTYWVATKLYKMNYFPL